LNEIGGIEWFLVWKSRLPVLLRSIKRPPQVIYGARRRHGEGFATAKSASQLQPRFVRLTESNKKATAEMPGFTDEKDLLKTISVRTEALLAERQDAPLTLRRATKIRSRRRRAELIAPSCPL